MNIIFYKFYNNVVFSNLKEVMALIINIITLFISLHYLIINKLYYLIDPILIYINHFLIKMTTMFFFRNCFKVVFLIFQKAISILNLFRYMLFFKIKIMNNNMDHIFKYFNYLQIINLVKVIIFSF